MEPDPRLLDVLKRLSAGRFEADDWLEWWENNADRVAGQLNRGQWLRLKPPRPGGFGPPCRCAFVSQKGALELLSGWGVEHERSDRYEEEWKVDYERSVAEGKAEQARKRKQFRPRLDCLKAGFPKLARFLGSNLDEIVQLGEPASDGEIEQRERALGAELPASYRRFLSCTSVLVYGDIARIGLPYTFRHPDGPGLPSAGRICFGEYWREADGDQVLFGETGAGEERPVLYYDHSKPSVHALAGDFAAWIESTARTLND